MHVDEETGQTIISGMGELHLEILMERMKREFRVQAGVGKPQVAYRETITRPVQKPSTGISNRLVGTGSMGMSFWRWNPERLEAG